MTNPDDERRLAEALATVDMCLRGQRPWGGRADDINLICTALREARAELAHLRQPASPLKQQLDAVKDEMASWPEWRRKEVEAEAAKTPLRQPAPEGSASEIADKWIADNLGHTTDESLWYGSVALSNSLAAAITAARREERERCIGALNTFAKNPRVAQFIREATPYAVSAIRALSDTGEQK